MPDDWFDSAGGSGRPVDVAATLEGGLDALQECVQLGALVALGTTSDGGALGVTITVDGRWRREYFRDGADLVDWLAEALPAVRAATAAPPASAGGRERQRRRRGL